MRHQIIAALAALGQLDVPYVTCFWARTDLVYVTIHARTEHDATALVLLAGAPPLQRVTYDDGTVRCETRSRQEMGGIWVELTISGPAAVQPGADAPKVTP